MLLSSQQLQEAKKRLAGPGNGTTFFKLLRIHPFDQLSVGEGTPRPSRPPSGSGEAVQEPGARGPEKHLGPGPDLSIQVLFYQLQRSCCVPTAAKRQ